MKFLMANVAETLLAGSISEAATTVLLTPGAGDKFPQPGANEFFPLTLIKIVDGAPVREIVYVTSRNTDSCTVVRAREGTVATTFAAGDIATNNLTAGCLAQIIQQDGGTFIGAVEMSGQPFTGALMKNCADAYKGDASNTIDIRNGKAQRWAPGTGNQTLTITGWPAAGGHGELMIYGENLGSANITIAGAPVSFVLDTGKFALSNSLTTNHGVALQSNGLDFIAFWSPDGGTTRYCKVMR